MTGKGGAEKSRNFFGIFGRIFAAAILMTLMVCCAVKAYGLWKNCQILEAQQQALRQEIEAEKERQLDALTDRIYLNSDEYLEREARDRFNFVNPGDLIIKIIRE